MSEPRRPFLIVSPSWVRAGRFAHQAPANLFAARLQPFDDLDRAIDRHAFLVAGDQEGEGAARLRMSGEKAFAGGDHRRQTAFHVRRAASVEITVADFRGERRRLPLLQWTGRHDVGVAGEGEQRFAVAIPRPEIGYRAEAQPFHPEAERFQPGDQDFLTAGVLGRDRGPADQVEGKVQGSGHDFDRGLGSTAALA